MIEEICLSLVALLAGDAAMVALWNGENPRFYAERAPVEPKFPYSVFLVRANPGGESCTVTGTILIDVWTHGDNSAPCKRIAQRVEELLSDRFLDTNKAVVFGVTVHFVGQDPIPQDAEKVHRQQVTFEWQGYRQGTALAILARE